MQWKQVLHDPSPWITALSTTVIAIYTVVLACVARSQAILTRRSIEEGTCAHVRPGFPNPIQPGGARWRVEVIARNIGPAGCTFNGFVVKFSDSLPTKEDFDTVPDQGQRRSTSTILLEGRDYSHVFVSPTNTNGQYCYGYLRWEDAMGRRRYYFCMRIWSVDNAPPDQDYFHQTGGTEFNRERQEP
jgi:hypothetical protein